MTASVKTSDFRGLGVYSLADVARLIGRPIDTVKRWIAGETPLYNLDNPIVLDFYDLISLWVISQLRKEGVPQKAIRTGREYLSQKLSTPYPFVHHEGIAALGKSVFGKMEFGDDLIVKAWHPYPGVKVDPNIQSGQPCLEGTRVPALMISDLVKKSSEEEWYELIASDYELQVDQVKAAVEYGCLVSNRSF